MTLKLCIAGPNFRHVACNTCWLTHQQLQHKSLLDVVVAVDGRRQALRQKLQYVLALGDLSNVLDIGRRHLYTERAKIDARRWSVPLPIVCTPLPVSETNSVALQRKASNIIAAASEQSKLVPS